MTLIYLSYLHAHVLLLEDFTVHLRQYGDHLYAKGEYEGAIENYVKTIGHLESNIDFLFISSASVDL